MASSVASISAPRSFRLKSKRDLWWQFTVRSVEMKHRGSYLGFAWAVLNPLLMAALYVTVFGIIFRGRFNVMPDETGVDYALAVFLGLILFHLLSETMSAAPLFIVSQPNLVKKVVFPLQVLPLAQLGAAWFHALISLALFFIAQMSIGRGCSLHQLAWLPLILIPHFLLTVGLAWLLSAMGVFFRDVAQLMPLLSQILLWSSFLFHSVSLVPPAAWAILKWNPLLHTVSLARSTLIWDQPVNSHHIVYIWLTGITSFLVGLVVFSRSKRFFAEVI